MSRVADTLISLKALILGGTFNKTASRKTLKRWGRMDSWIKKLEDPNGSDGPSSIEIAELEKK